MAFSKDRDEVFSIVFPYGQGDPDGIEALMCAAAAKPLPQYSITNITSWEPEVERAFQAQQTIRREFIHTFSSALAVAFASTLYICRESGAPMSIHSPGQGHLIFGQVCAVTFGQIMYWMSREHIRKKGWFHNVNYFLMVVLYVTFSVRSLSFVAKVIHHDGATASLTSWIESIMGFGNLLIGPVMASMMGFPVNALHFSTVIFSFLSFLKVWTSMVLPVAGSAVLATSPFTDGNIQLVMGFALCPVMMLAVVLIGDARTKFIDQVFHGACRAVLIFACISVEDFPLVYKRK